MALTACKGKSLNTVKGITHAKIITPFKIIEDGYLQTQNGVITAVGKMNDLQTSAGYEYLDVKGLLVSPGWIDAHTHGGNGYDYMNCSTQEVEEILLWLASTGVTGVLPTIASAPFEEQLKIVQKLTAIQKKHPKGAAILGLHLEGPYINPERGGAQPVSAIRYPSIDEMEQLLDASDHQIHLVTLAPENPGALDLIHFLNQQGVVASCGHSVATLEQFNAAVNAGLNRVTHTFNGMPPLHHREPGILGGALSTKDVFCELILDGVHVHPLIASLLINWIGYDRVVLITDATQAAGLKDGVYIRPGNRKIIVKNGEARLKSGSLAGSVLIMQQAVKNVVGLLDLPLENAVQMASLTAAASLGLADRKGSIEVGKDADLLIMKEDLSILQVMVKGNVVFHSWLPDCNSATRSM
jgi:N-acetylglucosamine-6-phosphate deacetylase